MLDDPIKNFFLKCQVEGYSKQTIRVYNYILSSLMDFIGNKEILSLDASMMFYYFIVIL